jgi:ketosteroid isomerase-like protein
MSQENVEIVRRAYNAWSEGGEFTRSLAAFDDAVVIRPIIGPEWRGPEGLIGMAVDWTEDLAEWSMSAEEFIHCGEQVLVKVHQTGVGKASGVPVDSDYWFVNTLRASKIVRLEIYADRAEALEAAGLSE